MRSKTFLCLVAAISTMAFADNSADSASVHRLARMRAARKSREERARRSVMFARVDTRRKATTPLQTFDNSGNGMLNGTYFIRQVLTLTDPNTSAITRAVGLTGTATFDGKGNFNFTGQEVDSTAGGNAKSYTVSGTYAVSASGLLQMTNPVDTTDIDYGGVGGAGEIIASATEGNYDDVLVAIPVGSGGSVQGTYQAGFIDYTMANAANVRDGYFTLTPNGSGSFGNVTVNGAMANQNSTATMQTYPNVTYSFSGNTGTINFPTTPNALTTLITGSKTFAVSSDGNIMVGGSPGGYDLIVGVKSPSSVSNSNFVNTYFTGALENDASGSCGEPSCIDSYYGSYLANGQGAGTQHQRYVAFDFSSFDYTADVAYNFPSNGMYNDGSFEWLMAPNGEAVLQVGTGQYYTLIVAFSAKQYTGNAPFINPDGILNSASFAPITNSIAPGEYVSVFGTGLGSSANAGTLPLPMTLGSAQVSVDSTNSPLLVASATLLNGLVPNSTPAYSFATFQVKANSASSNQVTLYTAATAPGVFTSTSNGIGPADVFHTNYTAVTASSPATAGETVFFYANGLGATNPVVQDGAAAPTNPTAQVSDPNLFVDIFDSAGNYNDATIVSAVLAPGLAGVYQINFTIPSGVASGTGYLELSTTDGYTSMAKISMK